MSRLINADETRIKDSGKREEMATGSQRDSWIIHCIGVASRMGDIAGVKLGALLLRTDKDIRKQAIREATGAPEPKQTPIITAQEDRSLAQGHHSYRSLTGLVKRLLSMIPLVQDIATGDLRRVTVEEYQEMVDLYIGGITVGMPRGMVMVKESMIIKLAKDLDCGHCPVPMRYCTDGDSVPCWRVILGWLQGKNRNDLTKEHDNETQ